MRKTIQLFAFQLSYPFLASLNEWILRAIIRLMQQWEFYCAETAGRTSVNNKMIDCSIPFSWFSFRFLGLFVLAQDILVCFTVEEPKLMYNVDSWRKKKKGLLLCPESISAARQNPPLISVLSLLSLSECVGLWSFSQHNQI